MADNTILVRLDGLKLKYEEIGQKPVSYTHLRAHETS